jgi:hypothetical protein
MLRTVVQHNLNTIRGTVMKTKTQNEKSHRLAMAASLKSGEAGIRTLGTLAGTLVFETSTIGHSVTSPVPPGSANHTPQIGPLPVDSAPRDGAWARRQSFPLGRNTALFVAGFAETSRAPNSATRVRPRHPDPHKPVKADLRNPRRQPDCFVEAGPAFALLRSFSVPFLQGKRCTKNSYSKFDRG